MRILIISDAWHPQVNGVVMTLAMLQQELTELGHEVEVIGPDRFRTVPMPTYRSIQLAVWPSARLVPMIEAFRPEALHIATEGPLGWAARRWAIRRKVAFTTSFHTRFPEYLQARARLPIPLGYAWLRGFHGRAHGTMVATGSMRRELASRGFRNLLPWSRGVDLHRFRPDDREDWSVGAADLPLCRPARGGEERRALPRARPAGDQGRGRRRAAAPGAAGGLPAGPLRRRAPRRRAGPRLCRGGRVRLPLDHRHVRPCPAGEPRLRHADRGASGHRPGGHPRRRPARGRRARSGSPRGGDAGARRRPRRPAGRMPSASPGAPAPSCSSRT